MKKITVDPIEKSIIIEGYSKKEATQILETAAQYIKNIRSRSNCVHPEKPSGVTP